MSISLSCNYPLILAGFSSEARRVIADRLSLLSGKQGVCECVCIMCVCVCYVCVLCVCYVCVMFVCVTLSCELSLYVTYTCMNLSC